MRYDKETVEKAQQASVFDYARCKGIDLVYDARDKFRGEEHDSLIITPSKNAWFWNSRGIHGIGALSFAQQYELADSGLSKGESFLKAMEMVLDANIADVKPVKPEYKPFDLADVKLTKKFKEFYHYLAHNRKLSPEVIAYVRQLKLLGQDDGQEDDGKIHGIFLWRDPVTKNYLGASRQGLETIPGHRSFKRIVVNSNSKSAFFFDTPDIVFGNGHPVNLRFFESEIDAMSFYDLSRLSGKRLTNTRLVAMDGLKKEILIDFVKATVNELNKNNLKLESIALGVDNDQAGQNFYQQMHDLFVNITYAKPNEKYGKDWNDMVKHFNK